MLIRQALRRRLVLVLASCLFLAGLGVATHALDHGGQPNDTVCGFCLSASHGKAPPSALIIGPAAAAAAVCEFAASSLTATSHPAPVPPARAPPLEAIG